MDNNELINSNNSIIFEDTIKTNNHKIICRLINIGKMYRMILLENEQTISSIVFTKINEEDAKRASKIALGLIQNMIIRKERERNILNFED